MPTGARRGARWHVPFLMTVIREFAPAKVNLTLEVLGKREDGYHELKSLVAFADVGDWLTLDTAQPVGVTTSGAFAASIAGANVVETTLRLLADVAPELQLGAVRLDKNLPVAAGIGGGSADAAALIRAVQKANPLQLESVDWRRIALRIGADVPVCLVSQLACMRGIGEIVAPLKLAEPARLDATIVNPLAPMPEDKTARVFRAYAAQRSGTRPPGDDSFSSLSSSADVGAFVRNGGNDLESAALAALPVVRSVFAAFDECRTGCEAVRMSGAGPTCFAIFDDAKNASAAAETIARAHPDWWVKAVTLG